MKKTTVPAPLSPSTFMSNNHLNTAFFNLFENFSNLFLKFTLVLCMFFACSATFAQTAGKATTGTGLYRNDIFWLNWDLNANAAGGDAIVNGTTRTFVSPAGVSYTATISAVTGSLQSASSYDFGGNNLNFGYGNIGGNTGAGNIIGLATFNGTATFRVTIVATYPGGTTGNVAAFVIGGSESMANNTEGYQLTAPSGTVRYLDKVILNNTWANMNTQLQVSNVGRTVRVTNPSTNGDSRGDALLLAEDVPFIDCSVTGGGGQHFAIGFIEDLDFGDAPTSYGNAFHIVNRSATGGALPLGNTNLSTTTNTADAQRLTFVNPLLTLGALIDVEGSVTPSANGTTPNVDDLTGIDDEDGLTNINWELCTGTVDVRNLTAASTFLSVWIDANRNGVFDTNERAAVTVPAGTNGAVTIPLTAISQLQGGGNFYSRFRLSTTNNLPATGFALDGEVEDHWINIQEPISSGNPVTICQGQTLNLTAIAGPSGTIYAWTGPNAFSSALQNPSITNVQAANAGTYTLDLTYPSGCSVRSNAVVSVTTLNTITAGQNRALCINTAMTAISLTTTGATAATFTGLPTGVTGTWASNVATISGTPTVAGTFNYTVTTDGACPASTTGTITVNALPVLGGASLVCIGTPTNVTPNTGGTWSSGTPAVATITNAGVVTGVSAGTSILTFTNTTTGCTNTRSITVNARPVTGGATQVCVGSTANVTPSTGGTWTASNGSVTITNAGLVTGVSVGTPTLFFTDSTTGCTSSGVSFNVTAAPNAGTLSGIQAICVAGTTTFTSNGNAGGTYTSDNTAVATVNASTGVVTGVAAGTATITYTVTGTGGCANAAATRTVTVTTAPNAGALSGTQTICVAGTTTFTATGNAGGSYTSDNTAVATVNASTGVVTGVAAGTATITYTVTGTGGCANATSTRTVTVTTAPNAGTLSGTQAICVAGTTTFTSNGNTGGSYTSDNTAIATVNTSTGVVTGVAAGTATITYTVTGTGGCANATSTRTVTVTTAPNAGTLSGTQAICVAGATTFTSNGNAGGSYTSSDTAIATVNVSTGVVTGVAAGTATITYTVTGTGGCANATSTRTVTISPIPTISINDITIVEQNGNAVFTVTLSNPANCAVSFTVNTANNTALSSLDYTSIVNLLVTIPAGSTNVTVTVPILNDNLSEGTETYFVNITSPTNATISDGQGLGTIVDDEVRPTVTISSPTVTEGNSAVFTVGLSNPSSVDTTVNVTTTNASATNPNDYS